MLYKQKFSTFIRTYDEFGYIINKNDFTDQITDPVGSIFLKSLSRTPKSADKIIDEIHKVFPNVCINEIGNDVKYFLNNLEEDGFIVSGRNEQELEQKDFYSFYPNNKINVNLSLQNIRSNISSQKYLDNFLKNSPHLLSFQIEITSRCNERCVHCYIPHKNKNTDIEPNLFYNIIQQCKEMGVMDITLSGGEPMLHPNFIDFLHTAKSNDFSVTILSNLTLLTEEIIKELKAICLSGVQVSLYSMNPLIHDSITKIPGSFEKTLNGIMRLRENNIPIQISCPTMNQNKFCYADVAKWATKLGIRTYTDCILMARYDHSTDNLSNRMQIEDMKTVINDIIENDLSYQELIKLTNFNALSKSNPEDIICSVGIMSLCMVANGNIFPCAGWQDYVCGNVTETSLKEIWLHSSKLNYLRNLRKKDLEKCINCPNQNFCAVCMVRNANESTNGNPLEINPTFCEIAKLNKDIVLNWKNKLCK